MTAANLVANGASLEDCHSNLFALTDLRGIKWRRYTATIYGPLVGPLDDPVLRSYANCLAGDVLSVWRRVPCVSDPNFDTPPPGFNNRSEISRTRELWVYWYGEEPDFTDIIADELKVNEIMEGYWENGLSYECRTLLFKALHNLLERCLLSRNFVRLGKWFVKPYGLDSEQDDRSEHVLFSFSFFLHGESTVCTSVDIQQHHPLRRLAVEHLAAAQGSATGFQVLLSPYGLSGVLTGQTFKHSDQNTQRLLNEWRRFYPIDITADANDSEDSSESADCHEQQLPPAVEVLVGGVRMCYPTSFVLVADTDDVHPHSPPPPPPQGNMAQPSVLQPQQQPAAKSANMPSVMSSVSLTPPTSPCDQALPGETKITVMPTSSYQDHNAMDYSMMGLDASQLSKISPRIAQKIVETVWHDSLTNSLSSNRPQSIEPTPPVPPAPLPPASTNEDSTSGSAITTSSITTTAASTTTTATTSSCTTNTFTTNALTGGFWDYTNPAVKAPCSCCRQKIHPKGRPGFSFGKGLSSHGSSLGSNKHKMESKLEKQQLRNARPLTPFHHRSSLNDDLMSMDHDSANQRLGINPQHMITSSHQDPSGKKKKVPTATLR